MGLKLKETKAILPTWENGFGSSSYVVGILFSE
jgi:hypothetical protein